MMMAGAKRISCSCIPLPVIALQLPAKTFCFLAAVQRTRSLTTSDGDLCTLSLELSSATIFSFSSLGPRRPVGGFEAGLCL